jgi:hypothetical protein
MHGFFSKILIAGGVDVRGSNHHLTRTGWSEGTATHLAATTLPPSRSAGLLLAAPLHHPHPPTADSVAAAQWSNDAFAYTAHTASEDVVTKTIVEPARVFLTGLLTSPPYSIFLE